jgi:aminoglycoside phosphotransferase (APT) family kinase protein
VSAELDAARAVRAGDELDAARLEAFLRTAIPDLGGPLSVEQFPRGHSNLTYLLKAGDREWVLRRPPPGAKAIQSGHDMGREYRVLSRLHPHYPPAPRAIAYCGEAESPLGTSFYVMERVRGVILRAKPPASVPLDAGTMRRLSENFVDNLAALHRVDVAAAGLSDLGHPEGYVQRQVEGWTQRYAKAQTEEVADMDGTARWLAAQSPASGGAALIHNDYKYDNVVLDPDELPKIRAVLDWEMATLGDPWADLGSTLAYWVDPDDPDPMQMLAFGPTALPGNLRRAEVVGRYAAASGRPVKDVVFYYALALFKVAVIAQQIYFRFKKGFTRDERFASFGIAVQVLASQAARATAAGRIDHLGS